MIDTILARDGNHFLSTRLLSAATSKQNTENKIASLYPASAHSSSAKKSTSTLNLEMIVPASASNRQIVFTPSRIKRK